VSHTALEIRQVSRRFGEVAALREADLTVKPGTLHALLGENGAGKTTLMRIAFGMLRPDSGELLVDGAPRTFRSPADAIAAGIGMVQQHPSNVGAMSVWENVILGSGGLLNPPQARRDVRDLVERLGFSLAVNERVDALPVAAQQRLEILKAVYREARLLILDEPTAILAPEEARDLYGWLRSFASEGGTAIVVTHKLEEARQFTDSLTVLRAGRTVFQSASSGVSTSDLTRAMIGESMPAAERTPKRPAGDPVVSVQRLSLEDDRRVVVVAEASFDVRGGEILGVAGVEGSGHHQLLLALAGRHAASAGRIELATRASIIPEDRHRNAVVLPFTLTENAAIRGAGERRGVLGWRELSDRVRLLMDRFDVRAAGPAAAMRTLSGGNQQKFVLARELAADPQLIVAENPTRGLDVRASAFVRDQLRAARDNGVAVVLYSSDLDEIIELADRVLVVQAGRVVEVPVDRMRIGAAMLGAA
jgi:simple sugar transport system ATP-binding protein